MSCEYHHHHHPQHLTTQVQKLREHRHILSTGNKENCLPYFKPEGNRDVGQPRKRWEAFSCKRKFQLTTLKVIMTLRFLSPTRVLDLNLFRIHDHV